MTGKPSVAEVHEAIASVPLWYHRIELADGVITPGINDSPHTLAHLPLPEDCSGLRVLDIGARDGFFSFEMERRGADVLALDFMPPDGTGFAAAKRILGSAVEWVTENVYNLTPERFGQFDIVLFLGVIYHLRNPVEALDVIWSVCTSDLYVESQILDNALLTSDGSMRPLDQEDPELNKVPLMQFYPGSSLNGDFTNWWAPNAACLEAMVDQAGFDVDYAKVLGTRGIVHGRRSDAVIRRWHRDIDAASNMGDPGPEPADS